VWIPHAHKSLLLPSGVVNAIVVLEFELGCAPSFRKLISPQPEIGRSVNSRVKLLHKCNRYIRKDFVWIVLVLEISHGFAFLRNFVRLRISHVPVGVLPCPSELKRLECGN
jgi:hypothetical protein